jgi:poly-gamma-glutamate synthesis protein (capsule biosynthesis protein)
VRAKLRYTKQPEDCLGEAVHLFRCADLALTNLEYPLTSGKNTIRKYGSHMKGHPDAISILQRSGISLVSLANNHILDYGERGLLDTLDICRENGIDTVGAGLSLEEARSPFYKKIRGIRIAVIAFCENEFSVASGHRGGAAPMNPIDDYRQIQEARQKADILLVVVHGGNEFSHYPSPRVVKQYRFYAESGASAVIAHHPHYIQGYELHNGTPILYSLGKLLYTRMEDPHVLEAPIATLAFDVDTLEPTVDYDFFRISLENTRLEELEGDEEEELRQRFSRYCTVLQDPQALVEEWDKYCRKREHIYLTVLTLMPHVLFRILRRLKMTNLIKRYARRRTKALIGLEDMMRCESQRDASLHLLERLR